MIYYSIGFSDTETKQKHRVMFSVNDWPGDCGTLTLHNCSISPDLWNMMKNPSEKKLLLEYRSGLLRFLRLVASATDSWGAKTPESRKFLASGKFGYTTMAFTRFMKFRHVYTVGAHEPVKFGYGLKTITLKSNSYPKPKRFILDYIHTGKTSYGLSRDTSREHLYKYGEL